MAKSHVWIPLSERKPKDSEPVLGCNKKYYNIDIYECTYYEEGQWFSLRTPELIRWRRVPMDITHWMEYPFPFTDDELKK